MLRYANGLKLLALLAVGLLVAAEAAAQPTPAGAGVNG